MPAIFIGHGSPMNAIETNKFTANWQSIVEKIPKPKAIVVISAHWYINSTMLITDKKPKMIYDMYGFPQELYEIIYQPLIQQYISATLIDNFAEITADNNSWGIDHGAWSVLRHMYPKADIPIVLLSINKNLSFEEHFNLAKKLKSLREQEVLILGSGNIVHNLRMMNNSNIPYPWVVEFDNYIKEQLKTNNYQGIINCTDLSSYKFAVPTPDHFIPLLYTCGVALDDEIIDVFNDDYIFASLSMTSYYFSGENKKRHIR